MPPKRSLVPVEDRPVAPVEDRPVAPAKVVKDRATCLFNHPCGKMTVRVVYESEADYLANAESDHAKLEDLPGYKIEAASIGPTASTGLAPWPQQGEWILSSTRD